MKSIGFKAFTLIELVITMLISSIVVLIAFSSYEIISHQFLEYRKKSGQVAQAELLNMLLQKDFADSKIVLMTPDSNLQFGYSNAPDVKYTFEKERIIRVIPNIVTDTFNFLPSPLLLEFEGKKISDGHSLVDEISFNAKVLTQDIFYHFTKQYASDILMDELKIQIHTEQKGI